MPNPFDVLGLAPGASLPEIKKAYARLLKQTRPDEDAAGFQHLQEAYEHCIAWTKAQQAAAPQPALAAGDDADGRGDPGDVAMRPDAGGEMQDPTPAMEPPLPRSRIVPMAPPRKGAAVLPPAQLETLLAEIIAAAEGQSAFRMKQWLHAHDQLVSLDVQLAVATALPAYILRTRPRLDPEMLGALFEYFIGAGFHPAGGDLQLRMAWEQVQAQDMATRELAALRRRYFSRVERLMLAELLEPPSAWRRRLLLAIPMMVDRMTGLIDAIAAITQPPAAPVLQEEAVAFWQGLLVRDRFDLRIVALAHAQVLVLMSVIVGVLGSLARMEPVAMVIMVASFLLYFSVIYFLLKGIGIVRFRVARHRERLRAMGQEPRDLHLMIGYGLAGVVAIAALVQCVLADEPISLSIVWLGELLLGIYLVSQGRGHRWEMPVLMGLMTAASWRTLAVLAGSWIPDSAIGALSCAAGAGLAVYADALHARYRKLHPDEARQKINVVAFALAGLCAVVLFLGLRFGEAKTDVHSDAAVAAQQDREARDAEAAKVQARIQEGVARMQREGAPWNRWAREQGITEPPRFRTVDEAFASIRAAVTPLEPTDTGYRAFHVPDGPLAGDWMFSGGDRERGPDRMVHYPPADASGTMAVGQMLCRAPGRSCDAFKRDAAKVPESLSKPGWKPGGGRLSWDSPSTLPRNFDCPRAQLRNNDPVPPEPIGVRLLFNGAGEVVDLQIQPTGVRGVDEAVLSAAAACRIEPTAGQPGIIETSIRVAY